MKNDPFRAPVDSRKQIYRSGTYLINRIRKGEHQLQASPCITNAPNAMPEVAMCSLPAYTIILLLPREEFHILWKTELVAGTPRN